MTEVDDWKKYAYDGECPVPMSERLLEGAFDMVEKMVDATTAVVSRLVRAANMRQK